MNGTRTRASWTHDTEGFVPRKKNCWVYSDTCIFSTQKNDDLVKRCLTPIFIFYITATKIYYL